MFLLLTSQANGVLKVSYCRVYLQMALSAASPIHRGLLCDTDCRWNVIAMSVDDRTRQERGLQVN